MVVLAADVGGTQMRVGIIDDDGTVVRRHSRPTAMADDGATALVALLGELLAGVDHTVPADVRGALDHAELVVGLPGRIDHDLGHLETAANIPDRWMPRLREDVLTAETGRRTHLANDADLAAVGEAWFGAARGHRDVLYVTISTGIGAGLILGGRLVHGRRSSMEIGHTIVDFDGSIDGQAQTVEHLGSGTALADAARVAGLPDGEELAAMVRSGDARACAVWDRVVGAAAIGVSNLVWIAAPSIVVIGGGLGRNGDLVLDPIRRTIATVGPADLLDQVIVAEAELGDDAGLSGAAGWTDARALR